MSEETSALNLNKYSDLVMTIVFQCWWMLHMTKVRMGLTLRELTSAEHF